MPIYYRMYKNLRIIYRLTIISYALIVVSGKHTGGVILIRFVLGLLSFSVSSIFILGGLFFLLYRNILFKTIEEITTGYIKGIICFYLGLIAILLEGDSWETLFQTPTYVTLFLFIALNFLFFKVAKKVSK